MKSKVIFFLLLLVGSHFASKAQNNNSPYSIIGIGDIESNNFDRTAGMASTGVAYTHFRYLSHSNPASYVKITDNLPQTTTLTFEVAARYNSVTYSGKPVGNQSDNNSSDIQFKKGILSVKAKKYWAISLGLLPFSTSNYSFSMKKEIPGSPYGLPTYVEGSGSSNQFFIANSFSLNKDLCVGLQTGWLFGQFAQKETMLQQSITDSILTTSRNYQLSAPYLKVGAIYSKAINKDIKLGIGATASAQTTMNGQYTLNIQSGYTTLKDQTTDLNSFYTIPISWAVGASLEFKERYKLLADYKYQPWQNANTATSGNYAYANSNRFSIGGEIMKLKEIRVSNQRLVFEKYFFQGGFYYSNSNLIINSQQITDIGGTIGVGVNAISSGLGVAAALQIGSRGTTQNNLIKEDYTQFTITLSYKDFWNANKKRYN